MADHGGHIIVHPLRSMMLAMVLGFHNAFEQEETSLEEIAAHYRHEARMPVYEALEDPARCFFWGQSPLLN